MKNYLFTKPPYLPSKIAKLTMLMHPLSDKRDSSKSYAKNQFTGQIERAETQRSAR